MTDIGNSPGVQAFEAPLQKSDSRVAEFDVRAKSPVQKLQHFLHANPTAVPAIVLLSSTQADRLAAAAEAGAHVLVTYFSGIADRGDRIVAGGYPGVLRDLHRRAIHGVRW